MEEIKEENKAVIDTRPKIHPFPIPTVHRGIVDEEALLDFLSTDLVPFNIEAVDNMIKTHRLANKPLKAVEICVMGLALVRDTLKEQVDDISREVPKASDTNNSPEGLAGSNQDSPADNS